MAYEVKWSPDALEDLEDIAAFIARDSTRYASAVVEKVIEVADSLQEMPLRGRVVPEFGDENIRELFVYSYRLIYRMYENRGLVLALIHGRRLLNELLPPKQ